jgi:class 3 adenylate cyclase/tetratricopeptide (TPR) repeat protein
MQQIADWLKTLGLSEYADCFAENGIDVSVLRHLTDQDLKDIGVLLGHRRKMLAAIAELPIAVLAKPEAGPAIERSPRDAAERRQLTVMFCDLVGSTALSARLDPEDLRSIITAYHRCCTELVERNGGFVAKYMGDGVLAYFGYPQAHEHDAERAVRAGLNLVEAVPKLETHAASPLQARVGIATGLVVVGDLIGAGAAQEQAVVGETPNLAARLQALAEPGTTVIASNTRRLVGGLFECRDLGAITLKGLGENVPAWQVLRASAVESRFEALRSTKTPLIGRDEEIELLMRRWQQAKQGDGQVVLISGEPGIGKSRIAQAIQDRLSAEAHTRLRYFCSPHDQDSALYPILTQLERAAGFRREDTNEQRLNKLEAVLAQGSNDLSEALPLLAELLSIQIGERYPPLNLTPQKRKEKTLSALVAQVEGLSARQPVLMVFEDVHWSDPTSRELLDLLVECVAALRVLAILTFRPEFTPPWIGRPHVSFVTLSRLPPRRRAEMITHVTAGKALPTEIVVQIVERTDGVPLFIEELTKTVVESGILAEAGDHYKLTGPATPLAIPTSLHASLLARLDRLAPTREIAQVGAALGRSFSHELISAVAQMPQPQINDALNQLASAELIFCRGTPPGAEYTFKHALVQDAAYSTLLKSRRQQIHTRIATTLEEKFPETAVARPEAIAHHYAAAGLATQAVPYWLKAAQAALQRSALTEAASQLAKGLDLIPGIADEKVRAELELGLQATLAITLAGAKGFAMPEVERAYVRARALCDQIGSAPELFPVLYGLFVFHWVRGNLETARNSANDMLGIALKSGDPALLLIGHFSMGGVLFHIGHFHAALDHLVAAQFHYDEQAHAQLALAYGQDFGVWTLSYLAQAQLFLGFVDKGLRANKEAVAVARRLNHPLSLCNALHFHALCRAVLRDPISVLRLTEEYLSIAREQGFPQYIALASQIRGWALAQIGKTEEGIELGKQGVVLWDALGARVALSAILAQFAESQLVGGHAQIALQTADEALTWIDKNTERLWESLLRCCRGKTFQALGSSERAHEEYEAALNVARQQQSIFWELYAATSLARLWRDQDKRTEARDLLAPIYGWFTEGFDTPVLQNAKELLNELA